MKITLFAAFTIDIMALVIASAASLDTVTAQQDNGQKRSIEGVWRVRTTPRNCVTGVPIPAAAFEGLFTFHQDGTMSVWAQNPTITTTRSPGHGLWRRDQGWGEYSFGFTHLRYSASTGVFLGKQDAIGTLVLDESGDAFTSEGHATVFDVNGTPATPGCSDSIGTRYNPEP